ncbi:MAG: prepilin-type N-terminal cleavage/methylation domain-containing protein [Bacillaceae bacterium]|jgi:prepilin-type N-terminal cleavage/methylation domain|nr:MAG: prepilin-type N-terminal cleavage/methylation domain-containing protein [Bacillaceae bacterium]RZI52712.1 prepilin-type N-terminal cleavage/methylation domain-containing protein [Aeribacillus pallidus]
MGEYSMKMKIVKKMDGFTLVEILISLVILSIIILAFLNLFVFTNKTTVVNNDQLVAIHLAKSTMERIKMNPFSYIDEPDNDRFNQPQVYTSDSCSNRPDPDECELLFSPLINNKTYAVQVTVSQTANEKAIRLMNVLVEVNLQNSKTPITSKVEGYVSYE